MNRRKTIPMAICYDFDGTLSPRYMQEYDFIPALGVEPRAFWEEARVLAVAQDADTILAYMRLMLKKAEEAGIRITRQAFREYGAKVGFFPGVEGWFGRISAYAASKGVELQHYIISSGLREMIGGTSIAGEFAAIYASGFMYDANEVAEWPALAVNYTTKTQFLFRINKGSPEVYDNSKINKYVPKADRPMPFENMVYVGDGETDIPCFRLVKEEGGQALAVYRPRDPASREAALRLLEEGRATIAAPADYREGQAIDRSVKSMVDRIEATARIGNRG